MSPSLPTFSAPSAAFASISRRPIVGLLTVLLLSAQLLLIGHVPHDLAVDDESSACVVCVLGHNLGSGLCHQTPSLPAQSCCDSESFLPASVPLEFAATAYLARGPPSQA